MNLIPFLDSSGTVKAWIDRKSGWGFDPDGNAIAFISADSLFDRTGVQIGWWYGDHARDRKGRVVLVRHGVRIAGISMPSQKSVPQPPGLHVPPERPGLNFLPEPGLKRNEWAAFERPDGLDRLRNWIQANCRESEPA